jgi:hypothetical protein
VKKDAPVPEEPDGGVGFSSGGWIFMMFGIRWRQGYNKITMEREGEHHGEDVL